jgi:hypothetical protein
MSEKSAAETVIQDPPQPTPPAPAPEKKPETPPKPASPSVVKDDKWLDVEISETEDKLHTLRELKKKNAPAAKSTAKREWGTVLDETN